MKRYFISVQCSDCKCSWSKRSDSIKQWKGRCRPCAQKIESNKPYAIEIRRKSGLKYVRLYGPPCGPKFENRSRGPAHYLWKGGVSKYRSKIYYSVEYKEWRKSVFSRDDYKCVACGINTHRMHADHIRPFALFPELRFDIANGRTFCIPCHRKYGACVSNGKITREASFEYAANKVAE